MKDFDFRLNNFDFIRLLAALQVVFLHTVHHLSIPVNEEFISFISLFPGVPIFFLLSGFLISASYEKSGSNIRRYFENRILRIFPALWICFIVSIVSVFIFYKLEAQTTDFLIWSLAQLSFVQFYNPDFLRDYGVGVLNGSLWTITVELQFYIAIPVLYFVAGFIKSKLTSKSVNIFLMISFFVFLVFLNSLYDYSGNENRSFLSKVYAVTLLPHLYMFLSGVFVQRNIKIIYPFLKDKVVIWIVLWGGLFLHAKD